MSSSNFFESFYPFKERMTALSDQDASWLEETYPGLSFVKGDGRDMPFENRSFDLVFSSAVIEHVGSAEKQRAFIVECCRVSRKYVFLTTPNRWHPVEFHTILPFLHWLPKPLHRKILRGGGINKALSFEENLNLLSKKDLKKMLLSVPKIACWQILNVRLFGFVSNLLIFIKMRE
jgi:ubiquinone/menaquinone biosynthesis C-methylase UbiE